MKDKGIDVEAECADLFDEFEADLFLKDQRRFVLITLLGCLLGAVAVVLW